MIEKRCNSCGAVKPASEFHRKLDGLAGRCKDCVRAVTKAKYWENPEARRAAAAEWRKVHPTYATEYGKRWYVKNRELSLEVSRRYRAEHPERIKRMTAEYLAKNRELLRKKCHDWYEKNKAYVMEQNRKWREANSEQYKMSMRNIASRRRSAQGRFTSRDIAALYEKQCGKCESCRRKLGDRFDIDHIVPIARGGSNWPHNLQLLCRKCNVTKSAKTPEQWGQEIGRLPLVPMAEAC